MTNIHLEETFEKFGYKVEDLKPCSCKLVVWYCSKCKTVKDKTFRSANKNKLCLKCSNKINANTNLDLRSEKLKEWYKHNDHPLLNTKRPPHVREALIKALSNRKYTEEKRAKLRISVLGKNNPMFGKKHSPESLEKMKAFQKTNPAIRGMNSNFYGKVHHGKGSWYICKDGSEVWMRSSWEIKFAEYLDSNNIEWIYEPKCFPVRYNNKEGTYTPDFYSINEDVYYEIKGWWRDDAFDKFKAFKEQYTNIVIRLLEKKELKDLKII